MRPFCFTTKKQSILWIYHILFIRSCADLIFEVFFFFFLFTFWLLWIALLRTFMCTFSYRHVFISCGHIPRNGLPFFFFNKRLHCYTHCLYPITFLLSSCNFYFLNNWEKIALFSRGTLHIILKKFVRYNFK